MVPPLRNHLPARPPVTEKGRATMRDHLDDLAGDALEKIVRTHHQRRLRRLGRGATLEPTSAPDLWVSGPRGPRQGNAVDVLIDGQHALGVMYDALLAA